MTTSNRTSNTCKIFQAFFVGIVILINSPVWGQETTLCEKALVNPQLERTCLDYEVDTRFESFLTEDRIQHCEQLFGEWPRTFKMCLRAGSRTSGATVDKMRACHRNFYFTYDMRNCLKFAALVNVNSINQCGDKYTDRFRPLKGMQCISDQVGVWRLDYEEIMFDD